MYVNLLEWSENVKQGMGHPSVFFRFAYRYLHELGRKQPETDTDVFLQVLMSKLHVS